MSIQCFLLLSISLVNAYIIITTIIYCYYCYNNNHYLGHYGDKYADVYFRPVVKDIPANQTVVIQPPESGNYFVVVLESAERNFIYGGTDKMTPRGGISYTVLTVNCPGLLKGYLCNESENLLSSFIMGSICLITVIILIFTYLWTEWPDRLAEFFKIYLITFGLIWYTRKYILSQKSKFANSEDDSEKKKKQKR